MTAELNKMWGVDIDIYWTLEFKKQGKGFKVSLQGETGVDTIYFDEEEKILENKLLYVVINNYATSSIFLFQLKERDGIRLAITDWVYYHSLLHFIFGKELETLFHKQD